MNGIKGSSKYNVLSYKLKPQNFDPVSVNGTERQTSICTNETGHSYFIILVIKSNCNHSGVLEILF